MIHRTEEIFSAFEAFTKGGVEAVIVQPSLPRRYVAELAVRHRLPAISPTSTFSAEGGIASYGANPAEIWRRSALYVDKILKGSKPSDLPVEQPIKFILAFNLKTAKAVGLTIPPMLLARADEVIE